MFLLLHAVKTLKFISDILTEPQIELVAQKPS